jgi:hypothetical protein
MAMQGENHLLRAPSVSNRLPYRTNGAFEHRVADKLVGPELLAQLLLGHDTAAGFEQVKQYLEDLGPQTQQGLPGTV